VRIAVAGSTTWGVTLAWLLAREGRDVAIIARDEAEAAGIEARRGLSRLPELRLPPEVTACLPNAPGDIDALVVAVPAQDLRAFVEPLPLPRNIPVLSGAKGIEHGTSLRVSQVLQELGFARISVLSGPTLAREVVRGLPAAAVIASEREGRAAMWQELLATPVFRTYRSDDVVGVELCGAYKNVVAIAAGASAALRLGDNTLASIVTRGLAEMTRLGVAMGAQPATFGGLAGVGDLAATCFSPLSRNHQLGELLAQGRKPAEAIAEIGEAVEGAATAPMVVDMAHQLGVEVPIAEQVAAVIAGQATVWEAMDALLRRSLKPESV
jgi:glycerol-3-phosphate dehydrogenase (NAD(P)+)